MLFVLSGLCIASGPAPPPRAAPGVSRTCGALPWGSMQIPWPKQKVHTELLYSAERGRAENFPGAGLFYPSVITEPLKFQCFTFGLPCADTVAEGGDAPMIPLGD